MHQASVFPENSEYIFRWWENWNLRNLVNTKETKVWASNKSLKSSYFALDLHVSTSGVEN